MWNVENSLKLIEDIRENPCLWDHSSPLYKFRNNKLELYDELATKYSVKASDIEKKIQSLRSQFRREHRKVKEKGNKAKVKCNWLGYKPLLFLLNDIEEGNEKNDTIGEKIMSDTLAYSVDLDESVETKEMDYSYNNDSQSQTATEKSVVKTEPSKPDYDTLQCMKALIDVVTKRDEFCVYADYVADKLRSSGRSKTEIHIAQHHIDNVVFNLVMGVYGREATGKAGIMNKIEVSEVPNFALKEEKM